MVNFVPALAYHFCLNLPAAFTQPRARLLGGWTERRTGNRTACTKLGTSLCHLFCFLCDVLSSHPVLVEPCIVFNFVFVLFNLALHKRPHAHARSTCARTKPSFREMRDCRVRRPSTKYLLSTNISLFSYQATNSI